MNLREFSLHEITDMADYLYGERQGFISHELAEIYFAERIE